MTNKEASSIDWNKVKTWSLVVLVLLFLGLAGYTLFLANLYHQNDLALTAKDAELQQANLKIGLSESKLVKGRELESELRSKIGGMETEFQRLVTEHSLKVKSKDKTILSLKREINGGTTEVVVHNDNPETPSICTEGTCRKPQDFKISYSWKDPKNRFTLVDPDIWTKNDETFFSQQFIAIEGYVFEAKDGQLQTRKLIVKEVDKDGKEIPGGHIEITEAKFVYTNRAVESQIPGLLDMATFRPYVSFDTALTPGIGLELFNLGRFLPYANLGLGPYVAADVSDILGGSLQRSRIGLHVQYLLVPPILETNVAIGLGIGTPFNDLSSPVLTGSLIFYLTPDLNPFTFWKDRPEMFGIKL